jgi:hypothetical protein
MVAPDWWDDLETSWADLAWASDPELRDEVNAWWAATSPRRKVGSRHHTVPRSYLERFATKGKIMVRDRAAGQGGPRNISDLAIRDFYTFINLDGQRDGRLEEILAVVEGGAKEIFDRILSPFHRPGPLPANESMRLALYLAFQFLRTPKRRREIELIGDYIIRTEHQHVRGINQVRVVPEPNEHLNHMTKSVFKLSEVFFGRPTMLITIDQPLFITADEPVIYVTAGDQSHVRHRPNCFKNETRRQKESRKPSRNRRRNMDLLHVYPTRPGALQAIEVGLPLTPRSLLVLGPPGANGPAQRTVTGAEAEMLAADVNRRLIEQAFQWVAAQPTHPTFQAMDFPAPGPLVLACDGGSPRSRELDQAPSPRRPVLLGRDWH